MATAEFAYEGSYFFIVANPFSSSVEPTNKNTRYLDRKWSLPNKFPTLSLYRYTTKVIAEDS